MKGYLPILNRFKEPQFLLFVLIAFVVWSVNRLNSSYQRDVILPLHIDGVQNPQQSESDSYYKIYCNAEGKGYQFLIYRLFPASKMITIPLSELGQLPVNSKGVARLNISSIEGRIARMARGVSVVRLYDDFMELPIQNVIQKMVKLSPNIIFDVSGGYLQLSNVSLFPDSILISGREDIVGPVDSVLTERIDISLHSTRINGVAMLSKIAGVSYSQDDVEYSVTADRFVEKRLRMPYKIETFDTTNHFKLFSSPTVADVVLNLSKNSISNFQENQIELFVEYADSLKIGTDLYKLNVRNLPSGVAVQYIDPAYITILKEW